MLTRFFYNDCVADFLSRSETEILGELASANSFSLELSQRNAWEVQIHLMKKVLSKLGQEGHIFFEYAIPRLGKRIDVVLVMNQVVFIIEFKVGETTFPAYAVDQVWDYALDLKNFHKTSHNCQLAPVLVSTKAETLPIKNRVTMRSDGLFDPVISNEETLLSTISQILSYHTDNRINSNQWVNGHYQPTPTIIEAAKALYANHKVDDITRTDASAQSILNTSSKINQVIEWSRDHEKKSICFVTGVPGAGKTLIGLKTAIDNTNKDQSLHSVFLSGNGPLVDILREALAIDKVERSKELGIRIKKSSARSEVKMFIQNVHHFRDDCLQNNFEPPLENVAIFDEAQRAWDKEQTVKFMTSKKGLSHFDHSEPEFLISCLNRHKNWSVIVCLVGGGQEIHTGEVGIGEWIRSIIKTYPEWNIFISNQLLDNEYLDHTTKKELDLFTNKEFFDDLHLKTSMRSFRAENLSILVKAILDQDLDRAKEHYSLLSEKYPIKICRDISKAKAWLRSHARGTERYGLIASSKAQRLKPYAIDVKAKIDPVNWFLQHKMDVRSSYFLEDAATEFQVQGLELDWTCVTWDGDFRKGEKGWSHWDFVGDRWNRIHKSKVQRYQLNAYRVLLTRARQGMVIFIPEGDPEDHTRKPEFYQSTYDYLSQIGFETI